jgi:hypothetical protein
MSDFQTIKRRIAKEMKRAELSASASAVESSVLSAIAHYEKRRFSWNEFNGAVKSTVASTSFVTLSITSVPRILRVDTIRMVIGNRDYPLVKRTWGEIDSIDSAQWYGYPEQYVIHSNEIRFYPPPNAVYPTRIAGVKRLDEISLGATGGATNAWVAIDQGEEMIRLKAKADLFRDELRNPSLANYFDDAAERKFKETNKENVAKIATGRTRPTRF